VQRDLVREWLKRRPFQPFRLHLTDGRNFDIYYPRMNLLGQTFLKVGIPESSGTDPLICDHTEYVRLEQIARLEPLGTPDAAEAS
jgi:hypothetical protein